PARSASWTTPRSAPSCWRGSCWNNRPVARIVSSRCSRGRSGGEPMRRTIHTIIGGALLISVAGCVDRTHTATLVGKIGADEKRIVSFRLTDGDAVYCFGFPPLANADIAIVASQPDGDQILASTRSAADGS